MATIITYPVDDAGLVFDSIVFDANTNDRVTFDAEVTENPVEAGSNSTDHVRPKPAPVSFDAVVTDYPLTTAGRGIATTSPQTPGQVSFGSASAVRAKPGRALEIIETLKSLQARGARVTLELGERFFSDMVIKTVIIPRDKPTTGSYRVQVAMVPIKIVASETVKLSIPKAKPVKKGGKQTPTTAPDAVKRKSWAASGVDAIGDALIPAGLKKWVQP